MDFISTMETTWRWKPNPAYLGPLIIGGVGGGVFWKSCGGLGGLGSNDGSFDAVEGRSCQSRCSDRQVFRTHRCSHVLLGLLDNVQAVDTISQLADVFGDCGLDSLVGNDSRSGSCGSRGFRGNGDLGLRSIGSSGSGRGDSGYLGGGGFGLYHRSSRAVSQYVRDRASSAITYLVNLVLLLGRGDSENPGDSSEDALLLLIQTELL